MWFEIFIGGAVFASSCLLLAVRRTLIRGTYNPHPSVHVLRIHDDPGDRGRQTLDQDWPSSVPYDDHSEEPAWEGSVLYRPLIVRERSKV